MSVRRGRDAPPSAVLEFFQKRPTLMTQIVKSLERACQDADLNFATGPDIIRQGTIEDITEAYRRALLEAVQISRAELREKKSSHP